MELIHETPPPILAEHGIEFFLETKPVGSMVKKHIHPAVEFIYIQRGLFHIEVERRRFVAHPGDIVTFRSSAIHMIESVGEGIGLYYVLKMSPSFLFQMFNKSGIAYILPFFNSRSEQSDALPRDRQPPEIQRIWESMIREYDTRSPSFFAMQRFLSCEFLLLLSRVYTADREPSVQGSPEVNERAARLISDSIRYINENYALPLSAEHCADKVHLSYSYYAKLFHAVVGKSFKEYLTDLRMAIAYNMLLSSSLRVSEVAYACGYENFSNFIVAFKKAYACTPGSLRRDKRVDTLSEK